MKWPHNNQQAELGIDQLITEIKRHGSIYRPIHQENDLGVDGTIELVRNEESIGRIVAVQVKSGDSYLSLRGDCFEVVVDDAHIAYWLEYMLPVILVCYSPSKKLLCWQSIRDYVEQEELQGQKPVRKIRVNFNKPFNIEALSGGIWGLAHVRSDERKLFAYADQCLCTDPAARRVAFEVLTQHPDSRDTRITYLLARRLLMDDEVEIARSALFTLGYGIGRIRWSFNPGCKEDVRVTSMAHDVCSTLTEVEIERCLVLIDGQHFNGLDGMGERCADVLNSCFETAEMVLNRIVRDESQNMERRSNALYIMEGCDDEAIVEAHDHFLEDPQLADVYRWMYGNITDPSKLWVTSSSKNQEPK